MQASQQPNKAAKFFCRVSFRHRLLAGVVFLAIVALFGLFRLAADDKIDIGMWLGLCGFKQKYDLPCPTCGMTTSAIAFAKGKIFEAFYIQPAGALFCWVLICIAFLAFFASGFGVYLRFLKRVFRAVNIKYIILVVIIIIAIGWAVTLARALGEKG